MRLDEALRQGIELLERGGVPSPRIAAEVLLMHAVGGDRTLLYGHPERELADPERIHYGRYLHERLSGRPTQYITGRQEFWGLEFRVNPSVMIPRPETEHVVERALEIADCRFPIADYRIADIGTGSGCIAVALARERPKAQIFAGDLSANALATAAENAQSLGLAGTVHFFRANLLSCFPDTSLDLVVSNPPYVGLRESPGLPRELRFEPPMAVFAGEEGLEVYRLLIPEAARVLRASGWVVLELGYNMAEKVRGLFGEGWQEVQTAPDLAGIERVISGRRASSLKSQASSLFL